ncbi:SpoIIE family protein phosphatase [Phormidium tenue]|uniref:SpoIIE family protein phosphatase n=1 Tax=Phormidium tenue FACHB-1050 TaxID=2692857 RepID=A0ABR8CE00_9CYAN|nr:SpoIIE family protein phosphatase [Phormidium tenue]MBD2319032.1 SpoIIE family protein phosphatase [Phormidium tenue FACHB-1050]
MIQILVIDDDLVMQMILKNTLQAQKYEVIVAKNGKEGISFAKQYQPALIICGWMMPDIDGLEVCRQIKLEDKLSSTIFILLTSKGAVEDKVQALDNGADDFLSKPIDKTELIASVRAGLRIYQLNKDLQLQKQLLEAELAEAGDYIQSLLPLPLKGDVNITAEFIPSSQLGGDCYDFYWLDPDHLAIYLIDTSGHGVGSALLSISILNLLRSQSFGKEKFYEPSAIMIELNRAFQMSQHNGRYFTMWYGVYERSQRKLIYANAGHPQGILISGTPENPQIQELPSLDMPIGFFPDVDYASSELLIAPDSKLFICSDGIFEVLKENDKIWGMPKFFDYLVEKFSLSEEISTNSILQKIQSETPNAKFGDDVSLLQIHFP